MRFKAGVVALVLIGIAVATVVIGAVGFRSVASALEAAGWRGFAAFCLLSLALFPVLGSAWFVLVRGLAPVRLSTFVWARQIRDAVGDVLPFSQLGGVVAGAREVAAREGLSAVAYAGSIVDLTTELVAQLLYTLYGVGFLIWLGLGSAAGRNLAYAGAAGLAAAAACTAAFVLIQRQGARITAWLAPRWFPSAVTGADAVQQALGALYRGRTRLAASVALHTLAWFGSGAAAWIAARFMGAHISLPAMLAIESLLYAVRSFAFMVPQAVGVQEGAYAVLGPLLGLSAETALAVSLLKRARDLTLGVPVLLLWQALESRRLLRRPAASPSVG